MYPVPTVCQASLQMQGEQKRRKQSTLWSSKTPHCRLEYSEFSFKKEIDKYPRNSSEHSREGRTNSRKTFERMED